MDASFTDLIESIASTVGMDAGTLLGFLALLSMGCRFVGKSIPDDTTGILGVIRKVCKFLGLYVSNKVTSGVTTNDVVKSLTATSEEPANILLLKK